jgi:hypothetical protein
MGKRLRPFDSKCPLYLLDMLTRHFHPTQSRAAQLEFQVVSLLLLMDIIYLDFAVLAWFRAVHILTPNAKFCITAAFNVYYLFRIAAAFNVYYLLCITAAFNVYYLFGLCRFSRLGVRM